MDGREIAKELDAWRSRLGYVPQDIHLVDDTLRRNVAFGVPDTEIDEERLAHVIALAQLDEAVAKLPAGADTIVGERGERLSGGERQRLAIARALYRDPELILLDEPTAFLDPETERALARTLDALRGRKTLIVIAHRLSTVRGCDQLVLLEKGRIEACGSFDALMASSERFRTLAAS